MVIIFTALFSITCTSQLRQPIRNLVFEGAGIRGIAYCGVVQELEARNMLQSLEKVGGTSSGAITALAISLGYRGKEIETIVGKLNFRRFNDGNFFFIGGINRMKKYFGWYRGLKFENWLENIIKQKTGDGEITFEQLHLRGFKDLYVTGTCLNKLEVFVFSHKTYPKMKVKDAVRISMSIPLYFEAVFIDKDGQLVRRPKNKHGLNIMVDGGFTGNFPIRMFDSLAHSNFSTLGFRIDSEEQIKNDLGNRKLAQVPITNLNDYMRAFYNMVIENLNRQPLTAEDWQRTISISDGDLSPRIRKLSAEEIGILVNNGRRAVKTYLN